MLLCLPKAPGWSNTKLSRKQLGRKGIGGAGRQREEIGGEERERQGDAWGQPGRQLPSQESRTHRMRTHR